jgi:hypothetical protein
MWVIIAEDGNERRHRPLLRKLLDSREGPVRIASAYVTETDLLLAVANQKVQLLTSLLRMDVISGATSLESLRSLIESGVQCRCLSEGPRLHGKVYIFGEQYAVVTSANLTKNALNSNIEVGVQLTGPNVHELSDWFDKLWKKANSFGLAQVSKWQKETAGLRREFWDLRRKAGEKLTLPNEGRSSDHSPEELRDLFDNANQFFLCNTDRVQGERTPSGGYELEEQMHGRSFAAAWESFKFPAHMERVQRGHAIFMFAKGVGIIGIGRAKAGHQILKPNAPDRIRNFEYEDSTPEWRVPVDWLAWRRDSDACRWTGTGLNLTFLDVSEDQHSQLRAAVKKHFLRKRS